MSDKAAIERVRELLDERGVHHAGDGGMTRWTNEDGCVCRAYTRPGHLTVDVAIMDASPEQAIAATLGNDGLERSKNGVADRGTCHLVNAADDLGAGTSSCMCFDCGYTALDDWWDEFNFCPNCGRKVVDE